MLLVLIVAVLVVVPIVELFAIIQVAHAIGGLNTIGLLLLISIAGGWLMRVQGFGVFRRFQGDLLDGKVPADPLVDGLLILVGGLLMLVPGFVTDGFGLLLLLPPVRAVARRLVLSRAQRRIKVFTDSRLGAAAGSWSIFRSSRRSVSGDVIDVEGWEEQPPRGEALPRGSKP